MSLGEGIHTFLSDVLSVADRIFPLTLPQGVELPAVTYQVISSTPSYSHSNAQDSPTYDALRRVVARIQFSFYGRTYDEVAATAADFKSLVTGYRGMWGPVRVLRALPDIELDDYEPDTQLYRRIVDVAVLHAEGGAMEWMS